MNYCIRKITAKDTLALRQKILKPFLSQEDCALPGDEASSSHHWGLFFEDELISIATFMQEAHPELKAAKPYRLRGMATESIFAGKGLGTILLRHCESELKNLGTDFLWFNARIKAFPFYERLGFLYFGELFDLDRIGPHKTMYKYLNSR